MKKTTRIDVFTNVEELEKFYAWAKTKEPKTRADMVRLLAEWKDPDMIVDAHPEIVEHKLLQNEKVLKIEPVTESSKETPDANDN